LQYAPPGVGRRKACGGGVLEEYVIDFRENPVYTSKLEDVLHIATKTIKL